MRYYLYLTPQGGWANSVHAYRRQLVGWSVRNRASRAPIHVSLTRWFELSVSDELLAIQALKTVVGRTCDPPRFNSAAVSQVQNDPAVRIELDFPGARSLASRWVEEFHASGGRAEVQLPRDCKHHLTLALGYRPEDGPRVLDLAMRTITFDEPTSWSAALYQRDGDERDSFWTLRANFPLS